MVKSSNNTVESANKHLRFPLIGEFQNRSGTTTKDQHFYNCMIDGTKHQGGEEPRIFLQKRPGMSVINTYTAGTGRGVFYWKTNPYVAIGSKLYKNTTEIGTNLLTGTSGHVGMEVMNTDEFGDVLFVSDGTYCYIIKSDGTYLQIPSTYSARANTTAYVVGNKVIPSVANGFYYNYTTAGTSAGAPPTYPTYIGGLVTDGTATLQCAGYYGFSYGSWAATTAYTVGARVVPTVSNGFVYDCTTAGTTSGTQPVWPLTIGTTVTDGTVVWTCTATTSTSVPIPKNHEPYPVFMDGYMFLAVKKADGSDNDQIYNCDINNPLSWNQVDFTAAESYPDTLAALARQNNVVMAFGTYTTEMFTDAGNATGSPLQRNESIMLQIGCAAASSIAQQETFVAFVGGSDTGGKGAWMVDGFQPKKISTPYIDRILDSEGTSISSAYGYSVRVNGHFLYILRLSTRTLVYDFEFENWYEWSYNSSGTHINFLCNHSCDDGSNKPMLLGATDGKLYRLDPTVYQDNGIDILYDLYTTRFDFGSNSRKFLHNLSVIGDQVSGGTMSIRWSDDDYTTYNTAKTVDLTSFSMLYRLGAFRRRSFNFTYTGNTAYRMEAIEVEFSIGVH